MRNMCACTVKCTCCYVFCQPQPNVIVWWVVFVTLSMCVYCMQFNLLTYLDTYKSRSQDVTRATAPGQTVLLPCILPKKDWQYQPDTHSNQEQRSIAHSGVVSSNFSERFQLDAEGLLIKDVKSTDQGTYTCVDHDDQRSRRRIRLFVPCEWVSYCSLYYHGRRLN